MATLGFNLPRISENGDTKNKEIKEIKEYLYQLTEQLRYVLINLDTENFTDSFSESLATELQSTVSAAMTSVRTVQGEQGAIRTRLSVLEATAGTTATRLEALETAVSAIRDIETGTANATAGEDVTVTFMHTFSAAPTVSACYKAMPDGNEWAALTVHSVTATGFKARINGTYPSTAGIAWTAIA